LKNKPLSFPVDILVNNAGVAHSFLAADAPDFSLDTAQEVINTTFWGQVYPTYYALPHLKATKGQLLNIISVASYIPYPRQAFYNVSQADNHSQDSSRGA
jgi:short-subunit dehydrogenase